MSLRIIAVLCALLGAGRAGALCAGDCDGDGAVSIAELIRGVAQSLAAGAPLTCAAFDRNADTAITINELIAAVNAALNGCPPEPIGFSAELDPDGPALLITPLAPLRGASVYALVLTGGIADAGGRSLQASAAFQELKGTDEPAGNGPIALFASDPDAAGNPYPDGRLVVDGGVRIPDRFALRGLPDTAELATARGVARNIADAVGAAGFFSTTAPIRIALSSPVDLQTVTTDTVKLFARRDAQLELAPLLDDLERVGVPSGTVALAISFPTQTIEDDLLAIRARLDQRLDDASLRLILTDPDPDDDLVIGVFHRGAPEFATFFAANPDVATVVHGLLPSPDFRGADGVFDPGKVSGAAAAADTLLDVYLTLPASAGPHRVAILQHGFAGDNNFALPVANELARDGLAGIAISAVLHGRRGNFLDLLSSTPLQVRDIFRQTNADQMALVRGIQAGVDVDADGAADLDPHGIGYLGVSLGGILGGTFIAVEPAIQMAVLNVAGGRVAFLGDNPGARPIYSQYYAMLAELDIDSAEFETFRRRLLELGQQALDPADPLDYARRWSIEPFPGFTPRRVLMQEGIGDPLVDNASTEALAAAGGLTADQAMADPGGVSGLWRFDQPGGHGIFGRADVRAQALRFLASGGTEIVAPASVPASRPEGG